MIIVAHTQGNISPVPEMVDLGDIPVVEGVFRAAEEYLVLWEGVLKRNVSHTLMIKYNPTQRRAKIVDDNRPNEILLVIPCERAALVKAYYVAFWLLGDSIAHLKEYLLAHEHDEVEYLGHQPTPPVQYTSETIPSPRNQLMPNYLRRQRRRHIQRSYCIIV